MRTPVMAGNWKMFKNVAETNAFFEKFKPLVASTTGREIVICPPFVDLPVAAWAARDSNIDIGGQNCYWENEGAFTGEISPSMLAGAGAKWVIIAHSERRQFFGETDETAHKRIVAALAAGLKPIVCVGELLADREAGNTNSVLDRQFRGGIAGLSSDQFANIVIAYEPVWAIGTGKTATPQIAAEAHAFIRGLARTKFGPQAADALRILYGGSVKPENAKELMAQEEIDGVLVGGASLKPDGFASIVNY
ncbi:MAG TPA: triose-phosphate isomerase [Bryobacteraceae bacterium]|nr:triose-phosphate isomerase [Bryobacteraceae bacterium]